MSADAASATNGSTQDEVRRKLLKPKVSPDEALSILLDLYVPDSDCGSDGGCSSSSDVAKEAPQRQRAKVVKELDSYDDVNYLVTIDGEKALLKIHNGVESDQYLEVRSRKRARPDEGNSTSSSGNDDDPAVPASAIDLHTAIYRHLAMPEHGVVAPRPIPPKKLSDGDDDSVCVRDGLSVVSPDHGPRQLVVRLQSWIHGSPLSTIQWCPVESLVDSGVFLGRMCRALDNLAVSDPAALRASQSYHAWDGRNLMDLRPYVKHIDEANRRKLVLGIIDSFEKTFVERREGESFRMGINHGDFNDANIIIGSDMKVSGVIDFGDTVHSWRVLDVAVAMAYGMISSYGKARRSISAACAILRGFHHAYPLTPEERKHLRLLIACRLATSVTWGNYTYKQNPENEYILFHSKPAWDALHFVWGADGSGPGGKAANVIDSAFEIACNQTGVGDGSSIPDCVDISFPDPAIADPFASARGAYCPLTAVSLGELVVTFVTGNAKKLEEVRRILGGGEGAGTLPFRLISRKIDLPELQGDPIHVAKEKCELAAKELNGPCIVEDTSLCFNALNGLPGIYIKWFLDGNGLDGLCDMISFSEDKSGYAQTVVAFSCPGNETLTFDGRTHGKIVRPRGNPDFGWDPVFEPDEGMGLTYAEMTGEQKDSISHRMRAFVKLREYIKQTFTQN